MIIAMTGSRGFVGTYLYDYFTKKNITVIEITRSDIKDTFLLHQKIAQADIIINLAGANIAQRWTKKHKKELYDSRIISTKEIVKAINATMKKQLLISTSAIGIYQNDSYCDEQNAILSNSYLAHICKEWEKEALKAKARVVIFRFSVILGHGGALQKMLLPFKLGLGGRIASGMQAFSAIHIEDLRRAYEFVIEHEDLEGIVNLSMPETINNKDFTALLAKKLHRPAIFPLPKFVLKLLFGEGASVVYEGQNVYPKTLLDSGFRFKYATAKESLDDLL